MATLAFAACSNEELPVESAGGNGNTEVVEGVPTYARLTIKMNGVKRTRTSEAGTPDEQDVKNIHVYVFANGVLKHLLVPMVMLLVIALECSIVR